jgi:hypothetical protein
MAREIEIERRQAERLVVQQLRCLATGPTSTIGPNVGSSAMPTISSSAAANLTPLDPASVK